MANNKTYTLESQTPYLWVILGRQNSPLDKEFTFYYERLREWCRVNAKLYGFIGHDKDTNEDGTPKFRHIHALIILKDGCNPRLSTSLNRIAQVCEMDTCDIDIQHADNYVSCLRYLVHKGYEDKYQYPHNEVVTNLTLEEFEDFISVEDKPITLSYLLKLIEICRCSKISILKQIGLNNYMKYRYVIKDVIEEMEA